MSFFTFGSWIIAISRNFFFDISCELVYAPYFLFRHKQYTDKDWQNQRTIRSEISCCTDIHNHYRAKSCSYQQEAVVPFVQFYHNTYVTHKILWFKQAVSSLNPNEESFSKIFKSMAHPPIFYYTCFCLTEDPTQTDQIISAWYGPWSLSHSLSLLWLRWLDSKEILHVLCAVYLSVAWVNY